jgi:hypothetical protein
MLDAGRLSEWIMLERNYSNLDKELPFTHDEKDGLLFLVQQS